MSLQRRAPAAKRSGLGRFAVIAAMLGGSTDWVHRPWTNPIQRWRRSGSKYTPHQGERECARRRRQIEWGVLNAENRGMVDPNAIRSRFEGRTE